MSDTRQDRATSARRCADILQGEIVIVPTCRLQQPLLQQATPLSQAPLEETPTRFRIAAERSCIIVAVSGLNSSAEV